MVRRTRHFLTTHRTTSILVFAAAVTALLLTAKPAAADTANTIGNAVFIILDNVLLWMTKAFAQLTGIFISLLVVFAQYNTFLNAPAVTQGWPIVRDLMNMMFIVALLIISAGTVLRLQNYRYNRLLGKLIIMALLVNFSKFIAVFLLQFAQVVMLTFVNAFRDIAFGNFSSVFGLDAVLNFSQEKILNGIGSTDVTASASIFITLLAGLIMMLIAFIVMLAITVVLAVRIVALWLLIILSPIAYALRILPNTEKYASRWWGEFGKYVVVGPMLAFFVWISLALTTNLNTTTTNSTDCTRNPIAISDPQACESLKQAQKDTVQLRSSFLSEVLSLDRMVGFIVGIIFLMFGLSYAQKSSGAAGSWVGKVSEKGFSAAQTLTGLNAIRDRTVRPIQGYLQTRQQRNKAEVSRRTQRFTQLADQTESRTIGTVGRTTRAVTEGLGAGTQQTVAQAGRMAGRAAARFQQARQTGTGRFNSGIEALSEIGRSAGEAGKAIIGRQGVTGGAAFGFRQGQEGEQIRRAEIQKTKSARNRFQEEIGRYGDMDPAARRLAMQHGNEAERYAAGMVALEKGEIDTEKRPEDKALAEGVGKTILSMANSAEEFNKAISGLSRSAREAMFGNVNVGAFRGGKRDILAQAGFIEEAYAKVNPINDERVINQQAADDFVGRNAEKMAELLKKSHLSMNTAANADTIRKLVNLHTVDDDTVISGTKDKPFAKRFAATMATIGDRVHQEGIITTEDIKAVENDRAKKKEVQDKYDEQQKMLKSGTLASRGGEIEYTDESGAKKYVQSIPHFYRSADTSDEASVIAKEIHSSLQRVLRTEGRNLNKIDYEKLKKFPDLYHETVAENLNRMGMKAIFEKDPTSVEAMLKDLRKWAMTGKRDNGKPIRGDIRLRIAGQVNGAAIDDTLSGIIARIPKETMDKINTEAKNV